MKKPVISYLLLTLLTFLVHHHSLASENIKISGISDSTKTESLKNDTLNYSLGNKEIKIYDEGEETSVEVTDDGWDEEEDFFLKTKRKKDKFRGHWAGFEFGLNNYVDKNFSISRNEESEFMDINTSKSWNFNVNFAQFSQGFASSRTGILTGLGLEWNNYHFSNQNTIIKADGEIVPLDLQYVPSKNRLQTLYLSFPLLMEFQMSNNPRNLRPYFSFGIIGSIKLYSSTLVKYSQDGNTKRVVDYDDYYLSPLRYGVTARFGFRLVKIYFNYTLTPLFIKNRGPELYPVAFGLALSF